MNRRGRLRPRPRLPPATTEAGFPRPDGHVVLIRSLAKGVAPELRVAAIMARAAALARIRSMRASSDLFVSGALQAIALAIVTAPGCRRHMNAVRVALSRGATRWWSASGRSRSLTSLMGACISGRGRQVLVLETNWPTPRDDVVSGLGCSVERLRHAREIVVEPHEAKVGLPSNLADVTTITY